MIRSTLAVCAAACALSLGLSADAGATPAYAHITSAGPLTDIYVGADLSCQVQREGALQIYSDIPGDCGTVVSLAGGRYGFDADDHDGTATGFGNVVPFTPLSQSAVTGAGTSVSPYTVTTVVRTGSSTLRADLTEVVSYVTGNDYFDVTTTVQRSNTGPNAAVSVKLYRGLDCYFGGSDYGYGYRNGTTGETGCSKSVDNSPAGQVEALVPLGGNPTHSQQSYYGDVWSVMDAYGDLTDACECSTYTDNGVAFQWNTTMAKNATFTRSVRQLFTAMAPTNAVLPVISGTVAPGATLTTDTGTWDHNATSYAYQWVSCDATSICTDIPGATSSSHVIAAGDVGNTIYVRVTASNAQGFNLAETASTTTVPAPPAPTPPPAPVASPFGPTDAAAVHDPAPGGPATIAPAVAEATHVVASPAQRPTTTPPAATKLAKDEPSAAVGVEMSAGGGAQGGTLTLPVQRSGASSLPLSCPPGPKGCDASGVLRIHLPAPTAARSAALATTETVLARFSGVKIAAGHRRLLAVRLSPRTIRTLQRRHVRRVRAVLDIDNHLAGGPSVHSRHVLWLRIPVPARARPTVKARPTSQARPQFTGR